MNRTFISVARSAGNIATLPQPDREYVLNEFETVRSQYVRMMQEEKLPNRLVKPVSIYYYASIADKLEKMWNSSQLPTLQQEFEMLKILWKD